MRTSGVFRATVSTAGALALFTPSPAATALVLKNLKSATAKSGQPSKREFLLEDTVRSEAVGRVKTLLSQFPVYPTLDLPLLEARYCV